MLKVVRLKRAQDCIAILLAARFSAVHHQSA